jgi:GxxExxY protein
MAELLYKDLTEKIIKVFLDVYNQLGYGYSKDIYIEALAYEMHTQGLVYEKQEPIEIFYKDIKVGQYILDFVNEEKVLLLIDTHERVSEKAEYAIINHLKSTKYEVGLVLNFGRRPEVRRKIFQNARKTFIKKNGEILDEK